ncbi:Interferon-induced GTP-binding protein Mx [Phytophthora palmivora]|uniref:Interferon-induced GTP-binding protein Mx n=1 Tax=Phytophthora palmivora TaxID=4796 RepID=A0A2P4XNT1_9STRA|nr:Interferon-induced GTP-binding protein Mx [Phytophthora palmivora]
MDVNRLNLPVPKSIRAKSKATGKTPLPSLKAKAKTLIKASKPTQSRGKVKKKTENTKKIRATWEATVNLFLERALIEEAWGEGEEGREVSVSQFKNKLNAIRKLYRSKRTRMLATGNRGTGSSRDEDETGDYAPVQQMYPEMPSNYLLQRDDNADLADRNDLTCDPLNVRPEYRKELGNELAALWPPV